MTHFSDQTWADFVRGIDHIESGMGAHLASACPECNSTLELWRHVARWGPNESQYAPPERLVRLAKSAFHLDDRRDFNSFVNATLLFDSSSAPVGAGLRGAAYSARQLVYEAEGLTVDLRFERHQNSSTILASGQILDREVPLRWLNKAAIILWTDKGEMVCTAEAGEHGEFQFTFQPQEHLRVSIAIAGRRTLRIALGNMD